jgi:hypothetical protein
VSDTNRYLQALHAMQSGVAYEEAHGDHSLTPKHLRVGVNAAMCDHTALVRLLVEKGVFSDGEYRKAMADEMEREVERYEARLSQRVGARITLG